MLFEIGMQQQMQDSDRDGIKDAVDKWPFKKSDKSNGRDLSSTNDRDIDGIPDAFDPNFNKPNKASLPSNGSGRYDRDKDGVSDAFDPQPFKYNSPKHNTEPKLEGDAAILKEAFEQLAKGGMTTSGRAKLGKIDAALSEADIMVNKAGDGATIVDREGNSTNLGANRKGRVK